MIAFILYYLAIPFGIIYFVQWFFKKYAKTELPPAIARMYAEHPIEKKWFRVIRRDAPDAEPLLLSDFETMIEAVDAMYLARNEAQALGAPSHPAFFVLNDKGEYLEEINV